MIKNQKFNYNMSLQELQNKLNAIKGFNVNEIIK